MEDIYFLLEEGLHLRKITKSAVNADIEKFCFLIIGVIIQDD